MTTETTDIVDEPGKPSSADIAKRSREWAKTVEALPELINPLDLSDKAQSKVLRAGGQLMRERGQGGGSDADMADGFDQVLDIVDLMADTVPDLFANRKEFELWRTGIPLLRRFEPYAEIVLHYFEVLGEFGSSTK